MLTNRYREENTPNQVTPLRDMADRLARFQFFGLWTEQRRAKEEPSSFVSFIRMTPTTSESSGSGRGAHDQPGQTLWSVVLKARDWRSSEAHEALQQLCQIYWRPVYLFIRERGKSLHDAEDLTQDFFYFLLNKDVLSKVDREKGRFRSFLRASLTHFLNNDYHKQAAQKRAPKDKVISFDSSSVGALLEPGAAAMASPDKQYDRAWALALISQVLAHLRVEEESAGRLERFERLQPCLTEEPDAPSYAEIAHHLNLTEAAVKMAIYRLRQRYGALLREEIAQTVSGPGEIEDELRSLFKALGR